MRELSVQAANGTLTQQDRGYIQVEIDQIKDEINRTARTTQYNKKKILNGEAGAVWSSSNLGVKANIHGAIGGTDQFGQYVSAEGNYDLEISVEEYGQAQVQKTRIFAIEHLPDVEREVHINLNRGIDTFGASSGEGWYFQDGELHITQDGKYSIFGETKGGEQIATSNYIHVEAGVNATVFLKDVYIQARQYAIYLEKANVDLYLDSGDYDNINKLIGGSGYHCSAVECGEGAQLRISSIKGDFNTDGKLYAQGSMHSAGIGGACSGIGNGVLNAGEISIYGGTIVSVGGDHGAGIGGAWYGNGGNISIYGGDITAKGGDGGLYGEWGIGGAAGIGAGNSMTASDNPNAGKISIYGGTVRAEGGRTYTVSDLHPADENNPYTAAAIGGGKGYSSGEITIDNAARNNITIADFDIKIDGRDFIIDQIGNPSQAGHEGGYIDTAFGSTEAIGAGKYSHSSDVTYDDLKLPAPRPVPDYPTKIVENKDEPFPYELREIKQFYDDNGKFLLDDPQKLTITQGNGKSTSVMIYGRDTMYDLAEKINNAISEDLGQEKYLGSVQNMGHAMKNNYSFNERASKFCTISDGTQLSSESVWQGDAIKTDQATLLVRSIIPGKEGEISFSGSEEILNVLGLNTINQSSETTYRTTVRDAHSGETVVQDLKTTGSTIHGLVHPNVDVEFDPMGATSAAWDPDDKKYHFVSTGPIEATLHLKDNTLRLQTGANEGERFLLQLGDMSADALGLSKLSVDTRENAARAITILDNAIDIVSTQRAKIGADTNTLEHTMSRLTIASENLSNAESRIRNADIAKMMLAFTKYQIMTQAGTSMLSQANQLPQQVLSLIR